MTITPSGRPEAICVAVVDDDERWSRRITVDLGEQLGASVMSVRSANELHSRINGHAPCHVLVINRSADPELKLLQELRARWSERELPIIVTDDEEDEDADHQIAATRAGANAFIDRTIHDNNDFLGKLVYSLAYE